MIPNKALQVPPASHNSAALRTGGLVVLMVNQLQTQLVEVQQALFQFRQGHT